MSEPRKSSQTTGHRHHGVALSVARAAHGRPLPGRLSAGRPLATPGDGRRLAVRRPAARRGPERAREPASSASRFTRRSPRRCAAAADTLAVDGVLVIGEHGDYPVNAKGQILYPRYEFFEQIVKVFERDGRGVPVFNDKHLSYSFEKASQMVAASQAAGFSALGRLEPAGHLAAAARRAAARLQDRRGADGRRRRVGRDGLSRARGDAVHARAAPQWRDRRSRRAVDPRSGGVAGRPRRPLVAAAARSGAVTLDLAHRQGPGRRPPARSDPQRRAGGAGQGAGGLLDRILATACGQPC